MRVSSATIARPRRAMARRVAAVLLAVTLGAAAGLPSRDEARVFPVPPTFAPSLVFSEDFDGPAGSGPDPARWGYDIGRWGESAGELQYYTDRTENARLDGSGNLEIVAKPERYADAQYTSARLQTRDKQSFRPPIRIAARIQMPEGPGLLSAFWTLGTDIFTRGWPECGEIDIVEVKGDTPSVARFHTHSAWPAGVDFSLGDQWTAPTTLAAGFHTYRIDWYSSGVEFYLDGALRFTVARADMPPAAWAFSAPHYLTLNTAVGNEWTGPPDATTPWPAVMRVDWVRAWALR
jgi:beta-glucanase (GH16 family)